MTIAVVWAMLVGAEPARAATLEQRLFYAAMQQPRPWYGPNSEADGALETPQQYSRRVETLAQALAEATVVVRGNGHARTVPVDWRWGRKALTAAVLTHWYEESRFALEVHAGTKHPVWTQDVGRATCLGQLHAGLVPADDWAKLAGTDADATRRCALWSARALTRMALYCGGKMTRFEDVLLPMFSGLSGSGCRPTLSARNKVARFAKIWREMERAPTRAAHEHAPLPGDAFLPVSVPNRSACYHPATSSSFERRAEWILGPLATGRHAG